MTTYLIIFYSNDNGYLNEVVTFTLAAEKEIEFHVVRNIVAMLYPKSIRDYSYTIQKES